MNKQSSQNMKMLYLVSIMLVFTACSSPPYTRPSIFHARSDVLYLPDTPSGHKRAEIIKSVYGFKQRIVFQSLDSHRTRPFVPIECIAPAYPKILRTKGVEGTVTVAFIVDEYGKVAEEAVVKSANSIFAAAALRAVEMWRFTPATYDGIPIRSIVNVPITFRMVPR
jgi:TonB family protein